MHSEIILFLYAERYDVQGVLQEKHWKFADHL